MTPRLYNIPITKEQNAEQVLQKIYSETQLRGWTVWEGPQPLMGNFKVLRLISAMNTRIICKVEGPGFILNFRKKTWKSLVSRMNCDQP